MDALKNDPDCKNLESAANRQQDALRFTEIPRTSKLFKDFLYDYEKVSEFYTDFGREISPLAEHARRVGKLDYDRARLADALTRINKLAGSSELTFKHIEMLRNPDSVAIITGQQAGLFTGPLYTIHKALTVVKLAACLREQGVEAVPVFWIASEDHDFEEVKWARTIDTEGHLQTIQYEPENLPHEIPVGKITLDANINKSIDEFLSFLPPSEFLPEIEQMLRESYAEGTGFAVAFSKLMAHLFKEYGVVLLDPADEGLKQIAAPLYAKAIEKTSEIAHALVERSHALVAAGYHAQVNVSEEMVPLFILDDGRRVAMSHHDGRFYVKGSEKSFAQDELAQLAAHCPNCFSPNVTLRPIVQDYLLPTAAYIGGPAELAYFAQLRAVYEVLERPLPCVLPRASFTIIEGRHHKTMEKYNLHLSDFFESLHVAITKVVENSLDRSTTQLFEETEKLCNEQLNKLEVALAKADASLADSLKKSREKILYQIEHLRTRFIHASARREETTFRQVERAYTTLMPNKNYQERELNIFYLLARYGHSLIDDLYKAADIGFSNHRLLHIGGVASQVVNAK
ncbi:MAG: bacillithiol biosynthesis cysteine-adding enzyme BshC [Acidobacteriota bacterium]